MTKKEKVKVSLIIGEQVFRTLKKAAGVVPEPFGKPLVGAADIALSIVEISQDIMNNRDDFVEIGKQACIIVATLVDNINLIEQSELQRDAALLYRDIVDIKDMVQNERYLVTEITYHSEDKNTIKECWRKIGHALSLFNLGSNIAIRKKLDELRIQIAQVLERSGNADAWADQVNFADASHFGLEAPIFAAGKAPEHKLARVSNFPRANNFVANNALFMAGELSPAVLERWGPGQRSGAGFTDVNSALITAGQVTGALQPLGGRRSNAIVGMNGADPQPPVVTLQPQSTEETRPTHPSQFRLEVGTQPSPVEVTATPVMITQPSQAQPGFMLSQTPFTNAGVMPAVMTQQPQQYLNQPQDQLMYQAYPAQSQLQPVLVPVQMIQDHLPAVLPNPAPVNEPPAPTIKRPWWRRLLCM